MILFVVAAVGVLLVVAGVALWSAAAALVVAGLFMLTGAGLAYEPRGES